MTEPFDPYHKWLGISPKDQPPDPYRLLGIERFECDPDVIANAADQRMGHVRTFQAGKRGDLSQKLLNEISRAKIDLMDAKRKERIDEELRAKLPPAPQIPRAEPVFSREIAPAPAVVPRVQEAPSPPVSTAPVGPRLTKLAPPAPKPSPARAAAANSPNTASSPKAASPPNTARLPKSPSPESEPMSDTQIRPDPNPETQAAEPGVVVFLIDESSAMEARVADGTKSKADTVATALNSLLNQLTAGPPLRLALVGYRADETGTPQIGLRWAGPLSEKQFVATGELADSPLRVEDRVRKVPGPGGIGVARQETIRFPVWYEPKLGAAASRADAFRCVAELLRDHHPAGGAIAERPLVVSFLGEIEGEDLAEAAAVLTDLEMPVGPPLVLHAHLTSLAHVPPVLYPSAEAPLPPGPTRQAFQAASVLPGAMSAALRGMGVTVNEGARGVVLNGKMVDLIRLLSLVKTYAALAPAERVAAPSARVGDEVAVGAVTPTAPPARTEHAAQPSEPPAAPLSTPTERRTLLLMLMDRSVEDPQAENTVWQRIQKRANETLADIAKRGDGSIDVAVLSYGRGAGGQTEVERGLGGAAFLCDRELAGAARRIEEVTEEVFNGLGGLVKVNRKKPVFVDLEPTGPAPLAPAIEAVEDILREWHEMHPDAAPPIVLHVTRGCADPDEIAESARRLGAPEDSPRPLLYHLVLTESPRRSLAYPADPGEIADESIRAIWHTTSPLAGREALARQRPGMAADARGLVVNGQFDLLLQTIEYVLGPANTD